MAILRWRARASRPHVEHNRFTPRLELLEARNCPSNGTVAPLSNSADVWNFVTAPDLHPMKVSVQLQDPGTAPGLVFVGPYALSSADMVGQTGPLIMDQSGNPIWFLPVSSTDKEQVTDFQVQSLFGHPVLTWWQGTIAGTVPSRLPDGMALPGARYVIYNDHYQPIMTIRPRDGFTADIHEFLITPQGDALFIGIKVVHADLTRYGGLRDGSYVDPEVQEIDLRTGRLIFTWNMAQHVPLSDSLVPPPTTAGEVWDAYHMNAVDVMPNGSQLLVSSRSTWTVYDISACTGRILWEIGGKQNQFTFPTAQLQDASLNTGPSITLPGYPAGSFFQYQHDVRYILGPNNTVIGISLFDDGGEDSGQYSGPYGPARGMFISLDPSSLTASIQSPLYYHSPTLYSESQGDLQTLANGDEFIGWGSESYYSEYAPNGTQLYDVLMPGSDISYRAFSETWVGLPLTRPAAAVRVVDGAPVVYASWNGSTETVAWRLLAGSNPCDLKPVLTTARMGFETALTTTSDGPFYEVQALDAQGHVLQTSSVVRVQGTCR